MVTMVVVGTPHAEASFATLTLVLSLSMLVTQLTLLYVDDSTVLTDALGLHAC